MLISYCYPEIGDGFKIIDYIHQSKLKEAVILNILSDELYINIKNHPKVILYNKKTQERETRFRNFIEDKTRNFDEFDSRIQISILNNKIIDVNTTDWTFISCFELDRFYSIANRYVLAENKLLLNKNDYMEELDNINFLTKMLASLEKENAGLVKSLIHNNILLKSRLLCLKNRESYTIKDIIHVIEEAYIILKDAQNPFISYPENKIIETLMSILKEKNNATKKWGLF